MEPKKEIEVFGTLTKSEHVFSVSDKVAAGSLVFEAIKPFTGYYHETPFNNTKPLYLYFAVEENYPLEDIIRTTQEIESTFNERFDAGKGFLKIGNEKFSVLRIRHLKNYDLLKELQERYLEKGIRYLKKSKNIQEEESTVKIVKFFNLEKQGEGIWFDKRENYHGYFELPRKISWEEFNELTKNVKNNWDGSKFDAALGAFYHDKGLHEFVRIYSEKIETGYLQKLKDLYLSKLK